MMNVKKLMLLGGLGYLLPVIEKAHELGVYVITVDYLPDNVAHKYSDEYHNVSIIDKDVVLELARKLQIDGIMSFAVDPGVVTAAYVAEQLNLPFQCSYDAVCILQDKSKFRGFLKDNGFNVPMTQSFSSKDEVIKEIDNFVWPVIVKPVDSAGSKGVCKVDKKENLRDAVDKAFNVSLCKKIIIEEFLDIYGFQSSADCFTIGGKLDYCTFSDQVFDKTADNPFVPVAEIYPATMKREYQETLKFDLQRLFDLLKVRDGIYNIECRMCSNKRAYIMEVSPRGGGNMLAKMQDMATGQGLIENEIRKAVGLKLNPMFTPCYDGVWASFVVYTNKKGVYDSVKIKEDVLNEHVRYSFITAHKGDVVRSFSGANNCLGNLLLRCRTRDEMNTLIQKSPEWLDVVVL